MRIGNHRLLSTFLLVVLGCEAGKVISAPCNCCCPPNAEGGDFTEALESSSHGQAHGGFSSVRLFRSQPTPPPHVVDEEQHDRKVFQGIEYVDPSASYVVSPDRSYENFLATEEAKQDSAYQSRLEAKMVLERFEGRCGGGRAWQRSSPTVGGLLDLFGSLFPCSLNLGRGGFLGSSIQGQARLVSKVTKTLSVVRNLGHSIVVRPVRRIRKKVVIVLSRVSRPLRSNHSFSANRADRLQGARQSRRIVIRLLGKRSPAGGGARWGREEIDVNKYLFKLRNMLGELWKAGEDVAKVGLKEGDVGEVSKLRSTAANSFPSKDKVLKNRLGSAYGSASRPSVPFHEVEKRSVEPPVASLAKEVQKPFRPGSMAARIENLYIKGKENAELGESLAKLKLRKAQLEKERELVRWKGGDVDMASKLDTEIDQVSINLLEERAKVERTKAELDELHKSTLEAGRRSLSSSKPVGVAVAVGLTGTAAASTVAYGLGKMENCKKFVRDAKQHDSAYKDVDVDKQCSFWLHFGG
ncbi:hypothetical protein IE53DRAFT_51811 [Violaceomyces palustris]|uniref:Uncharacterized protein n=1 Tax=Violaceomyces palustris TaxID=1673888 RepID=A0ACD0NZT2_9BASI|nr:hypothetical protein IE53DRAFT_51811 [Violaceomyces palustris]